MKKLLAEIRKSVASEYERAAAQFGPANNSTHESYAIILEEFEEATEQGEAFLCQLDCFWNEVRRNISGNRQSRLRTMQDFAEHAAAEWVQVAAMCHKATVTDERAC